jgi:flagellar biosynthesis protein
MAARADKAVALRYSEELPAPIILASGRGPLAEAIMRIARENGVTLFADPDLTESLIQLDVNTLIPESLYEAIAALLVYVRNLRMAK